MGLSTDAILFYGFSLEEDEQYEYEGEFDERDHDCYLGRLCDEMWNKPIHGCVLGTHCSCEYPIYYVAIQGTQTVAWRGYPKELGQSLVAEVGWKAKIKKFCKETGIKYRKPQWILVSDMR